MLEDLAAATRCRARLGVLHELEVSYIEKQPGPRPGHGLQPGRHAARAPDRARPRAAGVLPARRRRHDDHARPAALHRAHRDLTRPVPPRAGRHPAHPRGRHPLRARSRRLRRGHAGLRTRRRRRWPRSSSPCANSAPRLQPMLAALTIAARSLSRELAGQPATWAPASCRRRSMDGAPAAAARGLPPSVGSCRPGGSGP